MTKPPRDWRGPVGAVAVLLFVIIFALIEDAGVALIFGGVVALAAIVALLIQYLLYRKGNK
ncbi:MAG: hypothetical protein HY565_02980 [Candidatus Kerfeldbacteria bacterium]|nr:hypothetical protein [Candidatus Kerfeldbacteria bacterium]